MSDPVMNHSEDAPLPDAEYLKHGTVKHRLAHGKRLRQKVPLESHASHIAGPDRADPVSVLEGQATSRLPDLIPIRYGRMAASAFAFYRGGAAIMAADLSVTPISGFRAQLGGDAHLVNFGMFETPERRLIFGLNDFDETLPGPIEWDVKRLAASIEIAGRDMGFTQIERTAAVLDSIRAYREAMLEFTEMRNLDVWYAHLPAADLYTRLDELADRKSAKEASKRIEQALRRDHLHAFERLIERTDDGLRFASHPPLLTPIDELLDGEQREEYVGVIQDFLHQYRQSLHVDRRMLMESYRYVHMARKVVGVGSVGTRAWVVLLLGRDDDDPVLLQLKEAQQSVLAPYAGETTFKSQGRRVIEGQRLMQAASDHVLGHYQLQGWDGESHDFYVRQMWDGKASIDVARLTARGLAVYGEACGWTLARGHARSGDRIAMAGYLGVEEVFEQAIAEFASSYADTNERDHARLLQAIADGEVTAISGI